MLIKTENIFAVDLETYFYVTKGLSCLSVAAKSKTEVSGRSPNEIVSSNPAGGMDFYVLFPATS
jgi:hypothetical protein